MNTMKMRVLLMLIVGSLWVGGCNDDESTAEGIKLQMKAVTSLSTINGRTSATGLEFSQILLGVRELEFETLEEDDLEDSNDDIDGDNDDGEDDNEEVEFEGSFVVDLINGTSTPDFGLANVQPGIYEEIEIEMGPILENSNSIFIAFSYIPDGGGSAVQVEFSFQEEIEFEIEDETNGFQLDANTLTNMLVLLDLDALFSGIDLSTAVADEDGVVRINDSSNSGITQQILSNLEDACNAGEDDDNDDDIDED
jgi:hypothetical protein